jgi:putative membrane protein
MYPGLMGWGWGGYGMGLLGGLFMLSVWGLVVVGLVLVVRRLWRTDTGAADAPLDILKRRYARGEISKDEFDRMKQDLA